MFKTQTFAPLCAALLLGALAGQMIHASAGVGMPTTPSSLAVQSAGEADLDRGTFSSSRGGPAHPVKWIWMRPDGAGGLLQTTVLYKANDPADGYLFPGDPAVGRGPVHRRVPRVGGGQGHRLRRLRARHRDPLIR